MSNDVMIIVVMSIGVVGFGIMSFDKLSISEMALTYRPFKDIVFVVVAFSATIFFEMTQVYFPERH